MQTQIITITTVKGCQQKTFSLSTDFMALKNTPCLDCYWYRTLEKWKLTEQANIEMSNFY